MEAEASGDEQATIVSGQEALDYFASIRRAARLTITEGDWWVERTIGKNGDPARREGKIKVVPFLSAPVYVRVNYGLTVNLGNFNSGRADVSASHPCYPAEIDDCVAYLSSWVGKAIEREREELLAAAGDGGSAGNASKR